MSVSQEFEDLLIGASERLGKSVNMAGVRDYAEARMTHLASIQGDPGYQEAIMIETKNVAARIGIATVGGADQADSELIGIIFGALAIGARAI